MNKSILLVEDSPDNAALTLRALKQNRIVNEVVVARDGVEAVRNLSRYWLMLNELPLQQGNHGNTVAR